MFVAPARGPKRLNDRGAKARRYSYQNLGLTPAEGPRWARETWHESNTPSVCVSLRRKRLLARLSSRAGLAFSASAAGGALKRLARATSNQRGCPPIPALFANGRWPSWAEVLRSHRAQRHAELRRPEGGQLE